MPTDALESQLGMIEMAVQADREGLLPEQVIRRMGLHGYAEIDLERAVEEFAGRVEKLRRYFRAQGRIKAEPDPGPSVPGI